MGNCCKSTNHRPDYPHKEITVQQSESTATELVWPGPSHRPDYPHKELTQHSESVIWQHSASRRAVRITVTERRASIDSVYDSIYDATRESHFPALRGADRYDIFRSHTEDAWTSSRAYGCASFDVTGRATTIEWKGYGLKIQVLDNSIPHYLTTACINVSLHYINNQTYLPVRHGDHNPFSCSALYYIKVGSGKLCKPVTIEIQHCSNSEPEQLTFLRAPSEGEYFRPVTDAIFDKRTNCGRVIVPKLDSAAVQDHEYSDFSWFMIAMRWLLFRNTIHYKAQVYISKVTTMMHFIVTMALDLCSTVSQCGSSLS